MKTIGILNNLLKKITLVLIGFGVLFGGIVGFVEVQAQQVQSGFIVRLGTDATIYQGKGCETYRNTAFRDADFFCLTNPHGDDTNNPNVLSFAWKIQDCDEDTCKVGEVTYSSCQNGICTKSSNSNADSTEKLRSGDFECDVNVTDKTEENNGNKINFNYSISNCNNNLTQPSLGCVVSQLPNQLKPVMQCIGANNTQYALVLGEDVIPMYENGDYWVFRTASGSTAIHKDELNGAGCSGGNLITFLARQGFDLKNNQFREYQCTNIENLAALQAAKPIFNDVIVGVWAQEAEDENLGNSIEECVKNAKEGDDTLECRGVTLTKNEKGQWVTPSGTVYNDKGIKVNTLKTDGEDSSLGEGLISFFLHIILLIVDVLVFIFVQLAKVAALIMGLIFVLIILINPASPEYLPVVSQIWGIVASLANLVIIGTLIFFGISKVLGIKNSMTDSLSGLFLKIVSYALLLNFAFGLSIIIINLGYGLGFLLIASRGENPTSFMGVARVLVGNFLQVVSGQNLLLGSTEASGGLSGGATWPVIPGSLDKHMQQVARRILELVMLAAAAYSFGKNIKVLLFQRLRMFFDIAMSAMTAALYFSPVSQFKTYGNQLFQKLLIDALFTPAYIGAIILASALIGAFADTAAQDITSGFTQGVASDSLGASIMTGLAGVTSYAIMGAFAVGALVMIPNWFAKKYEDDMKAVGGAVSTGWGALKNSAYVAGAPIRGAGSWAGRQIDKKLLSDGKGKSLKEWWGKAQSGEKGGLAKNFVGMSGNIGRTAGNLLTGRTLLDLEDMGGSAKQLWDGTVARADADKRRNSKENKVRNSALLRSVPIVQLDRFLDYTDDALLGLNSARLANTNVDKIAKIQGQIAGGKASDITRDFNDDQTAALTNFLSDEIKKNGGKVDNIAGRDRDIFRDLVSNKIKSGDNKFFEQLAADEGLTKLFQNVKDVEGFDDPNGYIASKAAFGLPKDSDIRANARIRANAGNEASSAELMNDVFREVYMATLRETASQGNYKASQQLIQMENLLKYNIPQRFNRRFASINGIDNNDSLDGIFKGPASKHYTAGRDEKESKEIYEQLSASTVNEAISDSINITSETSIKNDITNDTTLQNMPQLGITKEESAATSQSRSNFEQILQNSTSLNSAYQNILSAIQSDEKTRGLSTERQEELAYLAVANTFNTNQEKVKQEIPVRNKNKPLQAKIKTLNTVINQAGGFNPASLTDDDKAKIGFRQSKEDISANIERDLRTAIPNETDRKRAVQEVMRQMEENFINDNGVATSVNTINTMLGSYGANNMTMAVNNWHNIAVQQGNAETQDLDTAQQSLREANQEMNKKITTELQRQNRMGGGYFEQFDY